MVGKQDVYIIKRECDNKSNIDNIVIREISNLIFDIYFMIIRRIAYNVNIITFLDKNNIYYIVVEISTRL